MCVFLTDFVVQFGEFFISYLFHIYHGKSLSVSSNKFMYNYEKPNNKHKNKRSVEWTDIKYKTANVKPELTIHR